MVTNSLMSIPIFNRFSPPCAVTDALADVAFGLVCVCVCVNMLSSVIGTEILTGVMLDVGIGMLSDMEIIVMATSAITLEVAVGLAYAVDVLVNLRGVVIIEVVRAIGVAMLADENANGLAAVMAPFEFTLLSP